MPDPIGFDMDILRFQSLRHAPIENVEFHQRRRSKRIDQHGHAITRDRLHFIENSVHDAVNDFIGLTNAIT
ncbi:hypothetical protein D9M68_982480 [compost metagenome]